MGHYHLQRSFQLRLIFPWTTWEYHLLFSPMPQDASALHENHHCSWLVTMLLPICNKENIIYWQNDLSLLLLSKLVFIRYEFSHIIYLKMEILGQNELENLGKTKQKIWKNSDSFQKIFRRYLKKLFIYFSKLLWAIKMYWCIKIKPLNIHSTLANAYY